MNGSDSISLMLDTGDSSSTSLNKSDWDLVFRTDTNFCNVTLATIGNQVRQSKVGRVKQMSFGAHTYANMLTVLIQNHSSISHLGLSFFKRHSVIIDFPKQKLYLNPASRFDNEDISDMSGLHLLRKNGQTFVHSVDTGSPADIAGIKPNDLLESINASLTSEMKMRKIRRLFKAKDGEKCTVAVKRGSEAFIVAFALKRSI